MPENEQEELATTRKVVPEGIHSEERALNLITFDSQQGFQVSPEAIELLRNVKEKIGIIAVAGKYRTGKSFLLNRILLNKIDRNGFGVGPTINPCTKGLWIWSKPIEVERAGSDGGPLKIFIVDSEGIGAFNEDQNHDTRIFLLALLLSSYFIYNSMGTIDENALQNLSLIVNLSKQLQIKNTVSEESDPDEMAKYFPSFMWVVRDFSLRLLDQYGNQINSKEYLESALKEQKGTSDNVEKKNRIRRMIMNFFKDRDCYTMVRPTEEEKDLQSLQTLQDERLRPEFVEQMVTLRQRIFKRVKPKMLNSKLITGEMFVELCQAYTQAINKGKVPCIESAWTYLCQNECQRAIQDAIVSYEKDLKSKVFLNLKQSDCINFAELKTLHRKLRDESVAAFKEKAVGQNLKDFEAKMLEDIQKKYVVVKQKCLKIYEQKCMQAITKDVEGIEQMIRQDLYMSIADFNQDLEKLKQTFQVTTAGILYAQKDIVIRTVCEKLIMKGYEAIMRRDKELLTNTNRQLTEKLTYTEKDLAAKKADFESERSSLQNKLFDLQSETQNFRTSSKLFEEKNKTLELEKQKLEVQLSEQVKALTEGKIKQEQAYTSQIKELKQKCKGLEESSTKSQITFERDSALKEQKMQFIEAENQKLTKRVQELFTENRDLMQKLNNADAQLKQLEVTVKVKEEEKRKELEIMKDFYTKKLEEESAKQKILATDNTVVIEKERQWSSEKQFLQEQLTFAQKQIEDNNKKHEALLLAINSKSNNMTHQDALVIQNNKSLAETIAKVESKNQQLSQKVSEIKIYQRVFKHSQSMQCKFCQVFFPSEIFIEHVKTCNKDNRFARSHFFQIPLSISISQTRVDIDPVDNRSYTEYSVQINFNNKTWIVIQKYKQFCHLHEKLINQYPNIKFPQSSFQFAQKSLADFSSLKGKQGGGSTGANSTSFIEDRRKILQQYLQDLALIPAIKESIHFKQFLRIEEHFPEFCEEMFAPSNNLLSAASESSKPKLDKQRPASHLGGNFKIISDIISAQKSEVPPNKPKVSSRKEEIEDLIKENSHFSGFNHQKISFNKSYQRNRYEDQSSSQATPTQKVNVQTDHGRFEQQLDQLSMIECNPTHLHQEMNPAQAMDDPTEDFDAPNHGHFYDDDQELQSNESPLKESPYSQEKGPYSYAPNCQTHQQNMQQRIQQQIAASSAQKQLDAYIGGMPSHLSSQMKKSTSSNNLGYSPSQVNQQSTMSLLCDRTNHCLKSAQVDSSQQLQHIKGENCLACCQKRLLEQEIRTSQDLITQLAHAGGLSMSVSGCCSNNAQLQQSRNSMNVPGTGSHSNSKNVNLYYQDQQQTVAKMNSYKNFNLIDELVQKCNAKARDFGQLSTQRANMNRQKLDQYVTPRKQAAQQQQQQVTGRISTSGTGLSLSKSQEKQNPLSRSKGQNATPTSQTKKAGDKKIRNQQL